jgi:hypothetical protein
MKRVVSISLGSSKRNHRSEIDFLGEHFVLERIGTDGDAKKMKALFQEMDGQVDAFGLGGFDLYLCYKNKKYIFREAYNAVKDVKITPVADGTGVKKTLEKMAVHYLHDQGIIDNKMKVLIPSAVSRYFMFEAFKELGYQVKWGDIAFSLDIGKKAYSSTLAMDILAYTLLPIMVKIPFKWLYPVGESQDVIVPKFKKMYDEADIIAGDFHYIYKYLADDMTGKIILTNTLTNDELKDLKDRNVKMIATTTPEFEGRSFATNVIEALACALLQKKPGEIQNQEFIDLFKKLDFKPRIVNLKE